jgi:hypothetical protein
MPIVVSLHVRGYGTLEQPADVTGSRDADVQWVTSPG